MLSNLTSRAAKRMNKALSTGLLVLGTTSAALAQGGLNAGKQGIQDATTAIAGYFDPATLLIYAIAAIVGLVGAIKVFQQVELG